MACNLTTKLSNACTSGIGKLTSRVQLLRVWALGLCANAHGASPNTLRYYHAGTFTEVAAPVGGFDLSAVVNLTEIYVNAAPLLTDIIVNPSATLRIVSFIHQPFMQIIALTDCTALKTFYAPSLKAIGNSLTIGNAALSGAPITSISLPLLASCSSSFGVVGLNNLSILSLPSLASAGNVMAASECPGLTSIDFPNWVPVDGGALLFNNGALNQATVDFILARCVLYGMAATTIALNGGDNASPGVQGQLDVAALTLAGCVVITN